MIKYAVILSEEPVNKTIIKTKITDTTNKFQFNTFSNVSNCFKNPLLGHTFKRVFLIISNDC